MLQCLCSTWALQRIKVQQLSEEISCSWILHFYGPDTVLQILCLQKPSTRCGQADKMQHACQACCEHRAQALPGADASMPHPG